MYLTAILIFFQISDYLVSVATYIRSYLLTPIPLLNFSSSCCYIHNYIRSYSNILYIFSTKVGFQSLTVFLPIGPLFSQTSQSLDLNYHISPLTFQAHLISSSQIISTEQPHHLKQCFVYKPVITGLRFTKQDLYTTYIATSTCS